MAQKDASLSFLIQIALLVSVASAKSKQVDVAPTTSAHETLPSWSASEEESKVHGLELLQLKTQKKNALANQGLAMQQGVRDVILSDTDAQAVLRESNKPLSRVHPPNIIHCNHNLSGVDDATLSATLLHQRIADTSAIASSSQVRALRQQRIFIAACLHQSEPIMSHWTRELLRFLLALKGMGNTTNLFVSVYESGSSDRTVEYVQDLSEHLMFIGVSSKIITGGVTRQGRSRIEFLADIRNRAMEPLHASAEAYDHVLWLSDNLFCASGVLQMLTHALPENKGGLGADAVCGMDYMFSEGRCMFYDTWVSHDIEGNNFRNERPVVLGQGSDELEAGRPFQVFSCWNAMVVFSADVFQEQKLFFRTNRENLNECAAAETELIFRDMWSVGKGKIVVSPKAASAYQDFDFEECAVDKQPSQFDRATSITWNPDPLIVSCCPNQQSCFLESWNRFGSPPTLADGR